MTQRKVKIAFETNGSYTHTVISTPHSNAELYQRGMRALSRQLKVDPAHIPPYTDGETHTLTLGAMNFDEENTGHGIVIWERMLSAMEQP